jgi:hypothetical protein
MELIISQWHYDVMLAMLVISMATVVSDGVIIEDNQIIFKELCYKTPAANIDFYSFGLRIACSPSEGPAAAFESVRDFEIRWSHKPLIKYDLLKPKVVTISTKVALSAFVPKQTHPLCGTEGDDVCAKSHIKWHACFKTIHVNRMAIAMRPMPINGNFNSAIICNNKT